MSRYTRSAPPANAAQLRASAAHLKAEIAELAAEDRDANAALTDLVGDPSFAKVEARVRELRFVIPSKRDVLARIEAAIPAAEERERRAQFAKRIGDLDRRTNKLARGLERRFTAAAFALTEVLEEMRANEAEWRALGNEGRAMGEHASGGSVEVRLRRKLPGATLAFHGFQSLIREARIPAWEGGPPLFDGNPSPRP